MDKIIIYYYLNSIEVHNYKTQLIQSFNTIIKGKTKLEIINYY